MRATLRDMTFTAKGGTILPLKPDAAMTMYRIITGACRQGTESFVNSLGKLKKEYTVREIIEITEGQYRADVFRRFFEEGI